MKESANINKCLVNLWTQVNHMVYTWIVWPKRRTAPFFEGEIKLAKDDTLDRGRTRLLLGSWKSGK